MKRITTTSTRFLFCNVGWFLLILIWLIPGHTFSQTPASVTENLIVSGTITSQEDSEPLPGVTILVKNSASTTGSITDINGNYKVNAPEDGVLVFSSVGFVTEEVPVNSRSVIDVALAEDVQSLEEVVVTGYSTQRKKDITGSVAVVDTEALKSVPAGSAAQALQGQAPGVNVINSGVPGADPNIFIRGVSSFGDSQPLVIVDGIQASLNDISAEDIESIQVLKDAGAAAIYGVRGANGVIVVTTKKGRSGRPTVTYDAYYGVQFPLPGNPFDLIINPEDFARLALIADPNNALFVDGIPDFMYTGPNGSGIAKAGDPAVDPSLYYLDPVNHGNDYLIQEVNKSGTNWFQEAFKRAPITEHNLTISGGTDKASYLVSLGYLNQQGTLIETYLKRYSARINTEFELGENVRIGQNLNVYYKDNPGFSIHRQFGGIAELYKMMPIVPTRDIQGNYGGTRAGTNLGSNSNTVANLERSADNLSNSKNAVGNVYAEIDFLRGVTARTSIGGFFTDNYNNSFNFTQYENVQGFLNPNSYNESSSYSNRIMWTNTLNYNKLFGKHQVKLLIGSESIENSGRSVGGSRQGYFSTDPDYRTLSTGTSNITNFSTFYEDALFSLFSRLDYAYDDKYLLGATLRRDGSSRFSEESRYGIFPSVSLGWRISGENFMQGISWLDDLKLRGSYGILGSQNNVDPENQFDLYGGGLTNAYYDIRGTSNSVEQGFIQIRSGNPLTGWERNIISNVGFDATLLNYKVNVSLEYYKKAIDGLLFAQTLPATAGGATPPTVNIGDIQNSGFDFSASYNGSINDALQFSVGANITSYKNEVVKVPDPGYFDAAAHQQLGTMVRNQEGQAVSSFFGYDVIGLFNSDEEVNNSPTQDGAAPGRFKYKDVNEDGEITADDRTFLGSPNPDFTYGINVSLNFKGFDFSTILYGSQGNEAVNTVPVYTHFFGTYVGAKGNALLDAWTPENTDTTVPIIENQNSFSTAGVFNSYFVEDASYLRMRSLILGYSFKPSTLERLGVNKFRLYLQAANLFTITSYTGLDPEVTGSSSAFGVDLANYPNNQRNFIFGINLSF